PGAEPWRDQVRAGLLNLGWQPREADQAIAAVAADVLAANDGGTGNANGDASANRDASANGDASTKSDASAKGDGAAGGAPGEGDVAAMLRAALRKLSRA